MEKVILTAIQVEELIAKKNNLDEKIEEIQETLINGGVRVKNDTNNFGDINYDNAMDLSQKISEKADIESLLSCYTLAEPQGQQIGIGSLVTYFISKATDPKLVGQEKTIMIIQKNYSGARPKKGYYYVSLDTNAGCAFYGAKAGNIVDYTAENGNQFQTVVTEVNNNYCMQNVPSRQKTK